MNNQIIHMCLDREIEKSEIVGRKLSSLSDEQLQTVVENHVPNPLTRTYARLFNGGTSNLFRTVTRETYDGGEVVDQEFNPDYVPTSREHHVAKELLEVSVYR